MKIIGKLKSKYRIINFLIFNFMDVFFRRQLIGITYGNWEFVRQKQRPSDLAVRTILYAHHTVGGPAAFPGNRADKHINSIKCIAFGCMCIECVVSNYFFIGMIIAKQLIFNNNG
jgi:hypothetical protein